MDPTASPHPLAFLYPGVPAEEIARVHYAALVKREAQRRIVAVLGYSLTETVPPWLVKQVNMLASALEALLPLLNEEQLAGIASLRAFWAKVKAIRAFSNWLETQPTETNVSTAEWPE